VPLKTMNFSDKTVVITGAGSGIGRALAVGFSRDGAKVFGIGRTVTDLEETAGMCASGTMRFVVGDVSRAEDVERLFLAAAAENGQVDILLNNAAEYPKTAFLASSHEAWSRTIHTNVMGMALCCRLALPGMLERGFGRIINLGSFAWKRPIPDSSAYSASKGAVMAFTRALASEVNREQHPDVLINELIPGMVRTRMSADGENPADVYQHAHFVASLPRGGPTGRTFVQSKLYIEDHGLRARLKRFSARIAGRTGLDR